MRQKYEIYKDSNIPWIGEIPQQWVVKKIKFSLNEKNTLKNSSLQSGAISYGEVITKDDESIPVDTKNTYQDLRCGEFLINPINLNYDLKSLRTALSEIDVCVSPAYIIAKLIDEKCYPHFIKFLLHQFDVAHMKTLGAGVRQTITFKDIGDCYWALPSLEEQKNISIYLDNKISRISSLIEKQEKLVDLYNERINAIVLKGLEDQTTKYIRLMHVCNIISRPVAQINGDSYKPLGLFNRGRGIFIKDEREENEMGDSDFFWIETGDLIFSGQFAWEGAVAMANNEHNGCVVSHRYPVIRGKSGIALTEYLLALFLTSHGDFLLNENSRGAAGRNKPLNMNLLLKEKIPIINMPSQIKIRNLISLKENFLKKSSMQIEFLREHQATLIEAAVSGKIDLRKVN